MGKKEPPVFRDAPEDRQASGRLAEQEQKQEDCRRRRSRFAGALFELLAGLFR